MPARRFTSLLLAGLSLLGVSCPRTEDVQPDAPEVTLAAAPPVTRPPAPPPPRPPAPTAIAVAPPPPPPELPPELVDDGIEEDGLPESDPPAPPEPTGKLLASIGKETWIYAEPKASSRRIGYLRAGALVSRRPKAAAFGSCEDGFYRIEPRGYVCVGKTATLDLHHPVVEATVRRPRRDTLPYTYAMSRNPGFPLYARLPTLAEQKRVEPDLAYALRVQARKRREPEFVDPPPPDSTPSALADGQVLPALSGARRAPDALVVERARAHSGFALLATFDHTGRRFGLTTDLSVLPLDRTRVIRPSSFSGLRLDDSVTLPVAFVKTRRAFRWVADERNWLKKAEQLEWRQAIPLSGASRQEKGGIYWQAKDGSWIRSDQAMRVDKFTTPPSWVASGRKWVDVSILEQSLVAYEGSRPVFVTLVSTGKDGLGDPKTTHSTVQGTFLIHTKHVTATMDSDDVGDEFDLRDVPYVQYFSDGFALHGAYWHDDFGTPRSHGCVNLAPLDAAWLFRWTDPDVPDAWHGALSLKKGTLVYTHP